MNDAIIKAWKYICSKEKIGTVREAEITINTRYDHVHVTVECVTRDVWFSSISPEINSLVKCCLVDSDETENGGWLITLQWEAKK